MERSPGSINASNGHGPCWEGPCRTESPEMSDPGQGSVPVGGESPDGEPTDRKILVGFQVFLPPAATPGWIDFGPLAPLNSKEIGPLAS